MFSEMIEKKRQEVQLELEAIEKRGRWRQGLGESEGGIGQAASAELQSMVDMETFEAGNKENRLEGNTFPPRVGIFLYSDIGSGSACSISSTFSHGKGGCEILVFDLF
jgi:hypothetical protein